jgi:hypothetical protein
MLNFRTFKYETMQQQQLLLTSTFLVTYFAILISFCSFFLVASLVYMHTVQFLKVTFLFLKSISLRSWKISDPPVLACSCYENDSFVIALCSLVEVDRRFGDDYCFHYRRQYAILKRLHNYHGKNLKSHFFIWPYKAVPLHFMQALMGKGV